MSILVTPDDVIQRGPGNEDWRVVDVVAVMDTESPFVGLLMVEAA